MLVVDCEKLCLDLSADDNFFFAWLWTQPASKSLSLDVQSVECTYTTLFGCTSIVCTPMIFTIDL